MITIRSQLRNYKISHKKIEKIVQAMLDAFGYPDFDIGILFTTDKTIRFYNKTYREKDKPTDILSFPFHPEIKAGERIKAKLPEDKNLGDLIISLEYVERTAYKWKRTFEDHLVALFAHGIAHLCNYDHLTDAQARQMERVEKKLLAAVVSLDKKIILK